MKVKFPKAGRILGEPGLASGYRWAEPRGGVKGRAA